MVLVPACRNSKLPIVASLPRISGFTRYMEFMLWPLQVFLRQSRNLQWPEHEFHVSCKSRYPWNSCSGHCKYFSGRAETFLARICIMMRNQSILLFADFRLSLFKFFYA